MLTIAAAGIAGSVILSDCSLSKLRPIALGQNSFLYAADGSLLGSIPSSTNRQPLQLGAISPWLAKATVAIEDRRFYHHGGLDYQRDRARRFAGPLGGTDRPGRLDDHAGARPQPLHRRPAADVRRGRSKEACLANKLADRWTKKQILAAYLNEVFYGDTRTAPRPPRRRTSPAARTS